mmetsp:Transcript_15394/g.29248  ORF Transcript_15394/g.29248 Transcript_15394/m.29248 type:complete len:233 (-) Transcript_15394:1760-2458(-)
MARSFSEIRLRLPGWPGTLVEGTPRRLASLITAWGPRRGMRAEPRRRRMGDLATFFSVVPTLTISPARHSAFRSMRFGAIGSQWCSWKCRTRSTDTPASCQMTSPAPDPSISRQSSTGTKKALIAFERTMATPNLCPSQLLRTLLLLPLLPPLLQRLLCLWSSGRPCLCRAVALVPHTWQASQRPMHSEMVRESTTRSSSDPTPEMSTTPFAMIRAPAACFISLLSYTLSPL